MHGISARVRLAPAIAFGALTASCGTPDGPRPVVRSLASPAVAAATSPEVQSVDTLLRDMVVPWGIAESPDGGVFVAERPGRIRYLAPGADSARVWATLDVYADDPGIGPESGLLGIALDPDTSRGQSLYVMATTWRSTGDRERRLSTRLRRRLVGLASPLGALRHANQVLRVSHDAAGAQRIDTIVPELPTAFYHAGGSLAFGPDGYLYVGVGDALLPQLARDARAPVGKLLRYTRDGRIPADNPNPASPVFARGLRNTQALAWLPGGVMIGVDHGPSGMDQEHGRQGRDELNLVRADGDYGWPIASGWETADGLEPPLFVWEQSIAPAGLALRPSVSPDTVQAIVGGLRGHLEQLTLARAGGNWRVVARSGIMPSAFGRVRSVLAMRDGTLLVTTSNRDARGVARPGDDLVLRLTLGQ